MREFHVHNNGLGVQSSTLYLMSAAGEIPPFDVSVFSDTAEEPQSVYDHLAWLRGVNGPPLEVLTGGRLGNDLMSGKNSTGQRVASIPCFTAPIPNPQRYYQAVVYNVVTKTWSADHDMLARLLEELQEHGREALRDRLALGLSIIDRDVTIVKDLVKSAIQPAMIRRQCSKEYKIEPIEAFIKRKVLGLDPGQRVPRDVRVFQYIGISLDEAKRSTRIRANMPRWSEAVFPLLEKRMTRFDCIEYLIERVPHRVPKSACTFCPYHDNATWLDIQGDTASWGRVVQIDRALRTPGVIVNRGMDYPLYLHRMCLPIEDIDFRQKEDKQETERLQAEFGALRCEGVCGV